MTRLLYSIFFFCLVFNPLESQVSVYPDLSFFDVLIQEDIKKVEIYTDLEALTVNKSRAEVPTSVLLRSSSGKMMFKGSLNVRGKFRARICDFPPLKLDLKKSTLKPVFGKYTFDKYKIVTHCMNNLEEAYANLEKERLVYEMYNGFSEYSYRVHSIQIVYKDIHDPNWVIEAPAFIIESNKQLEDRLNGELMDTLGLRANAVHVETLQKVVAFNYMIGNADWNLAANRNVKLLWSSTEEVFIPIPYDFDFSSIVAPSYLRLQSHLGQKKWDDRVFINPFSPNRCLQSSYFQLETGKEGFIELIDGLYYVQRYDKLRILNFLDEFFVLESNSLIDSCPKDMGGDSIR